MAFADLAAALARQRALEVSRDYDRGDALRRGLEAKRARRMGRSQRV